MSVEIENGRKNLKSNVIWQYLLQLAKYALPFVTLPYLARVLGPEAYSVRAYTLSVMVFVQTFTDFGFLNYGTMAVVEARKNGVLPSSVFWTVVKAKGFFLPCAFVMLMLVSQLLPILKDNIAYATIAFLAVAINSLLPDYIFQGYEKMALLTRRFILSKILSIVLIFLLIHGPLDLIFVPVIDVVSSLFALAWSYGGAVKEFGLVHIPTSAILVMRAIKESAKYFASSFCSTVLSSFTVIMVGLAVSDSIELSVWSMSLSVINGVQALYSPLANSLYPHMLTHQDYKAIKKICLAIFPLALLAAISIALLSNPIILIFGGSEYAGESHILAMLSPVLFFSCFNIIIGWPILGSTKQVRKLSISSAIAAAFSIFTLTFLWIAGLFTIEMAAIVRSLAEALLMVLRFWFAKSFLLKVFQKKPPIMEEGVRSVR